MNEDELVRLVDMIRQIAETVVMQGHKLEALAHRVTQLERERLTNAVSNLYQQRDIIE